MPEVKKSMKLFILPDSDDNEAEQILERCLRPGREDAEVVEAPGGLNYPW